MCHMHVYTHSLLDICNIFASFRRPFSTKILDFRGFDSSRILTLRGGILVSIGDVPESLSQAMLVGIMLVGRLGVLFETVNIIKQQTQTYNENTTNTTEIFPGFRSGRLCFVAEGDVWFAEEPGRRC